MRRFGWAEILFTALVLFIITAPFWMTPEQVGYTISL